MTAKKIFLFILLYSSTSFAQISDLLMRYEPGYYSALGGTGLVSLKNSSSMDKNPASLCNLGSMNISIKQSSAYYSYNLLRLRDDIGYLENNWNNLAFNLDQASLVMPLKELSFGVGIYRKLSPIIENKKIAVTYSDLFAQETKGNVYSVSAGIGYNLANTVLFGISFNYYFGKLSSFIRGENHDLDIDKWASIDNDLKGINFKAGMVYLYNCWGIGVTVETPFEMKVKNSKQISGNQLYNYLLPVYGETNWNQPLVVSAGVSYYNKDNFLFEADYELRKYKPSVVQINLFEFGGNPVWEDVRIFRLGIEYSISGINLPLKVGYAFVPQLYYSNNSIGLFNVITSYKNTVRNVKSLLTAGTTLQLNKITFDLTIEQTYLKWNRVLTLPQTVNDEYKEVCTMFSIMATYTF